MAVPLAALAAGEGAELTDIEMSAETLPPIPGEVLDEGTLPNALIPTSRVELAIAPPSDPQADVSFSVPADLVDGRFYRTLDASALPPAPYRVWARACLGEVCGARSALVE